MDGSRKNGDENEPALRRRLLFAIVAGNVLLSFGFSLWQSLFNNYAVDEFGVGPGQMGWIQSIREVPGLLGFVAGLLALLLSEMRLAAISIVAMGAGIILTGVSDHLTLLSVSTLVMSTGFHFFVPSVAASLLMLVGEEEGPRALGRLGSMGALGALVGSGAVFVLYDLVGYRALFYATGALLVVGGFALLSPSRHSVRALAALPGGEPKRRSYQRLPIRRRYWLYYALEFLMGSRRHIFSTFAVFLLVQEHHVAPGTVTLLYVYNNFIGLFLNRQFGGIIARFGERRVLLVNFAVLPLVFLGYAFISDLAVLYLLFAADQILFGFTIALQSYLQKIAVCPEDITANLSVGQTINHASAVIIPVVGGAVWEAFGGRYTFLIGVGIALISLVLTARMRTTRPSPEGAAG